MMVVAARSQSVIKKKQKKIYTGSKRVRIFSPVPHRRHCGSWCYGDGGGVSSPCHCGGGPQTGGGSDFPVLMVIVVVIVVILNIGSECWSLNKFISNPEEIT